MMELACILVMLCLTVIAEADDTAGYKTYHHQNDLSVDKGPLIIKSPPAGLWSLCPPGVSKVICFDKYISLWMNRGNRDRRSVRRALRVSELTPAKSWQLCPPGVDRIQCFEWYLDSMLKSRFVKKRSITEATSGEVRKRQWHLCPDSQDKMSCFENFMSLWVNSVSQVKERKRYFLGKRSVECKPGDTPCNRSAFAANDISLEDVCSAAKFGGTYLLSVDKIGLSDFCDPEETTHSCLQWMCDKLSPLYSPEVISNSYDGSDDMEDAGRAQKRQKSPCPAGVDPMTCFHGYLKMYAQMGKSSNNRFVGRSVGM